MAVSSAMNNGVVRGQDADPGADADLLRPSGYTGGKRNRRRHDAEAREVMFRQPDGIEPRRLGLLNLL
jgi:hypothetical protein